MSIIVAAVGMVGALVISFAIPPHRLFRTQHAVRPPSSDPTVPAGDEEAK